MLIVKYLGGNCFRMREGEAFILIGNPKSKAKADIIVPDRDEEINKKNVEPVKRKQSFWTPGPGEFEVGGVEMENLGDKYWLFVFDSWRVVWAMDNWQMPDKKKIQKLGQVDVIFLTLNKDEKRGKEASELIKRISPYIVVPGINWDDYQELGEKWPISFLDAMDREDLEASEKLKLKRSDVNEEATEIHILTE